MVRLKKYTKNTWLGTLLILGFYLPLAFLFIWGNLDRIFFILMTISVVFVFLINKDVFMSSKYVMIKYTNVPFIKFKFVLSEITKIQLVYMGGRGNKEALKINLKSGKKRRFYLSVGRDFQDFINDARVYNIEVDTSRHPKFK
jgi:hypothetical protein